MFVYRSLQEYIYIMQRLIITHYLYHSMTLQKLTIYSSKISGPLLTVHFATFQHMH